MNEIKHKTSVTVETVDGTYHFDLARIKAHVDGLSDLTFKMDNGRGDRVAGGKFDADAVGLSVQIDGGVLAVCAIVEGPIGDDGSQIAEVQVPVFEFSPSFWTVYSMTGMTNLKQFLRD